MPNWCSSHIVVSDSPEKLQRIEAELKKALKAVPGAPSDFGDVWLGNLSLASGFKYEDIRKGGSVPYSRGYVAWYGMDHDQGVYFIDTESAWSPSIEVICVFVSHISETAEISYYSEEPGMGLYWSNMEEFADAYRVDLEMSADREAQLPFYKKLRDKDGIIYIREKDLNEALGAALDLDGTTDELIAEFFRRGLVKDSEYLGVNRIEMGGLDEIS